MTKLLELRPAEATHPDPMVGNGVSEASDAIHLEFQHGASAKVHGDQTGRAKSARGPHGDLEHLGPDTKANNVELVYVPFYASWLNRIEAQFTALRYFALDGTDHESHRVQGRAIRRYIAWRDQHAQDEALCELAKRANVA